MACCLCASAAKSCRPQTTGGTYAWSEVFTFFCHGIDQRLRRGTISSTDPEAQPTAVRRDEIDPNSTQQSCTGSRFVSVRRLVGLGDCARKSAAVKGGHEAAIAREIVEQ